MYRAVLGIKLYNTVVFAIGNINIPVISACNIRRRIQFSRS